jgi:hypothetical protein
MNPRAALLARQLLNAFSVADPVGYGSDYGGKSIITAETQTVTIVGDDTLIHTSFAYTASNFGAASEPVFQYSARSAATNAAIGGTTHFASTYINSLLRVVGATLKIEIMGKTDGPVARVILENNTNLVVADYGALLTRVAPFTGRLVKAGDVIFKSAMPIDDTAMHYMKPSENNNQSGKQTTVQGGLWLPTDTTAVITTVRYLERSAGDETSGAVIPPGSEDMSEQVLKMVKYQEQVEERNHGKGWAEVVSDAAFYAKKAYPYAKTAYDLYRMMPQQ